MELKHFIEKLNKVDGKVYVIEEEVQLVEGVYEAELQHDNVNIDSLSVYTGSKLTGERIEQYSLSTPSLAPWKKRIRIYADVPVAYISYETIGDTIEAEDVNKVQEAITVTQEALNSEETRAKEVEGEIVTALEEEETRAQQKEEELAKAIADENERAISAEAELRSSINGEVTRALIVEAQLKDALDDEISRAQVVEMQLEADLSTEIARATEVEEQLQVALDAEVIRARGVESQLESDMNTEVARATEAEEQLQAALDAEVIRAKGVESQLESDMTVEVARATEAEEQLQASLDAEVTRAMGVESQLDSDLTVEVARATEAEKQLQAALDAEVTRAMGVESQLESDMTVEVARATEAEEQLQAALNAEVSRATAVEVTKVDKVTGMGLSSNDYTTAEKAKLSKIAEGAEVNVQSDWNVTDTNADAYIKNKPTSMPASDVYAWAKAAEKPSYTKSEVGLGNVPNVTTNNQTVTYSEATSLTKLISGEVLSVAFGKISKAVTNLISHVSDSVKHITATERTNWGKAYTHSTSAHAPADAEQNIIVGVQKNSTDVAVDDNRKVNITVPTSISELENDAGYITAADVDTSQNHVHSNKSILDKITQTMLDKLSGIAEGANKYVHPSYTEKSSGLYKVTVDASGHVSGTVAVTKEDITALGIPGSDTNTTYSAATQSTAGLMSASDKKKLDGIATGANAYSLPTASSSTLGGVKTTSTITSNSGYTACPIISGVPYYKDTNTTYSDATSSAAGLMSAYDKRKLDDMNEEIYIETGAFSCIRNTDSSGSGASIQMVNGYDLFGDFDITFDGTKVTGNTVIFPDMIDSGYTNYMTVGAYPSHDFRLYNSSGSCLGNAILDVDGWFTTGGYNSSGGDYAEYWEWEDQNILCEDRVGLFVTFNDDKIRLSNKGDNLAKVGIISASPSLLGDSDVREWRKKYLKDIYGRYIYEETTDKKGRLCKNRVLNPEYDETQTYIKRSERPEWSPVATHGKLVVRDDGTCIPGGFCVPSDGGIATASDDGIYVMERLDDSHIRVYIR